MSIKIPRPVLFILSFAFALALYWPSINGAPIWDDFTFWFHDPVMQPQMKYSTIWLKFAWPFSVSLQKLMLGWWQKNFIYYHIFNFILHFANSFLVYKLGRHLRLKYPFAFFLLFLLHPVCVISTAWMIQIKTLLCFFFALASILTFLKGNKNMKWMVVSWILFWLSLASKSASLTLPVILFCVSYRTYKFSKVHLLIPFFLLSGWSAYRVLTSPLTLQGTEKAAAVTKVKVEDKKVEIVNTAPVKEVKPVPVQVVAPEKKAVPAPKKEKKKKLVKKAEPKPESKPEPKIEPKIEPKVEQKPAPIITKPRPQINNESSTSFKFINPDFNLILQTLNYYFWQTILPISNAPVKGLNYNKAGVEDFIHLIFLICLIIIFRKTSLLLYLAAAHFLLLPFLGIMPAPFMNITWVSDQHLYLVLPALLAFWMRLIDLIKSKYAIIVPVFFTLYFSYKTYEAIPTYKNSYTFYEKSLQYNPYNVPIAYNLAFARLLNGDWEMSYDVLSQTYFLSIQEPLMRKNIYYPHLLELYVQLKKAMNKDD